MTKEDIIRMAREAGIDPYDMSSDWAASQSELERFAALTFAAGAASTRPEVAIAQAYMCGREEGAFAERELCSKAAVASLKKAIEEAAKMEREAAQREFWEACKQYGKAGECAYLTYKAKRADKP